MTVGGRRHKPVDGEGHVKEGERADAVARAVGGYGGVAGAGRVGVDGYLADAEVGDPDFGDASGGIASELGAGIVLKGTVGDFDDEVNIFRVKLGNQFVRHTHSN